MQTKRWYGSRPYQYSLETWLTEFCTKIMNITNIMKNLKIIQPVSSCSRLKVLADWEQTSSFSQKLQYFFIIQIHNLLAFVDIG